MPSKSLNMSVRSGGPVLSFSPENTEASKNGAPLLSTNSSATSTTRSSRAVSNASFPESSGKHSVRQHRSSSHVSDLSYPHVVRPVPVWIADQAGIAKKWSAASNSASTKLPTSQTIQPNSSSNDNDNSNTSLTNNNENSPLKKSDITSGTVTNVDINNNIANEVTQRVKGKSVSFNSHASPTNDNNTNPNSSLNALQPQAMIQTPTSDIRTRLPSYQLPTYPPQQRIASGANRWTSFVNSTINIEALPAETRVDIEALNAQTDLSGEWAGHGWDNDSRGSASSMTTGWLSVLFCFGRKNKREPKKPPPISDGASKEGNLSFSRARYFVSEQSREQWKPKLMSILLNGPYVPVTLRAINFILSVIALSLACSVFIKSHTARPAVTQQASTIMALCCQTTALVYLVYITYDEYAGKPLGLRDAKAKIRLIMLDLLFIIFSSANLSLAFNTLYDSLWLCQADRDDFDFISQSSLYIPYNHSICTRQRGLASFIFLSLVSWVITFTISIFRLVERVSQ